MTPIEPKPVPVARLPWPLIMATLIAASALWFREGQNSPTLLILGPALLFSYLSDYRLESETIGNRLRLILFGSVLLLCWRFPSLDTSSVFEARYLDACAEVCMAEIVVRAWTRHPTGYRYGVITVLFSGVIFLAASNTSYETWVRYFTPPYMLFLALSLQSFHVPLPRGAVRRAWKGRVVALSLAILIGAGTFFAMMTNRQALNLWGMRFLEGMHLQETGLNDSPQLGSLYGREGTLERVLRIRTEADVSHLRAMSFDTYVASGGWAPPGHERHREAVPDSELHPEAVGTPATATRMMNLRGGYLFMPLNTVGLKVEGTEALVWDRAAGGPLRTSAPAPSTYTMLIGKDDAQGLFCDPPDLKERTHLLNVPPFVDPRVKLLARTIVGNLTDPMQQARAIEAYLPAHHGYSLQIDVGRGDPISNFLLTDQKKAQCEFFGSGAVILMRCVGIPARYAIGYYAHEREDDAIVVRQRDAHAWAECWIDGKGWITIDATPGDGRPDQLAKPLPAWKRFTEWLQDRLAALREKVTGANLIWMGALVLVLASGLYLLQGKIRLRWRRAEKVRVFTYTLASVDLNRQFARFEALCRRRGIVCPPDTTWQEYLTRLRETLPAVSTFPLTEAQAFILIYNAVRFGSPEDHAAYTALKEQLIRLERSIALGKGHNRS